MRLIISFALFLASAAPSAQAACGGDFDTFLRGIKAEATSKGYEAGFVDGFLANARPDPKVIRADRSQGVFQMPFIDFSRRLISQTRIDTGRSMGQKWDAVFDAAERDYGVSRGVLLAFWAFETDYGAVQGNFNTLNALLTLAHDCRRPNLFRPQIFAALELYRNGDLDPATTKGAWAGEIGMVQMLPEDILLNGVDGDGDGHVTLKTSAPDALLSGARMLRSLGWRPNEPWIQEVRLPAGFDFAASGLNTKRSVADWAQAGVMPRNGALAAGNLPASIVVPQGRGGPAFITYPNFDVYFEWNQSFVYVMTAAYFGTRLMGAPIYEAGNPDAGLDGPQMQELQRKLAARGYDVGKIDGILGAGTRAAVQDVQQKLGLPADAWPTPALLARL